jgi:hypothetical protein
MRALLLVVGWATVVTAAPAPNEPAAKKELFAQEEWYKAQKGDEVPFVGVLQSSKSENRADTVQHFNPYRLQMQVEEKNTVEYVVMLVGGGQEVRSVVEVQTKTVVRDVYVGDKTKLLDPYTGKTVKLIGKAVETEIEGRTFHEIWPARLEVVPEKDDKTDAKPKGGDK